LKIFIFRFSTLIEAVPLESHKTEDQLNEQTTIVYASSACLSQVLQAHPEMDCATVAGKVYIRPYNKHKRSLFAARAMTACNLVLGKNTFIYTVHQLAANTFLPPNRTLHLNEKVILQAAEKVLENLSLALEIAALSDGEFTDAEIMKFVKEEADNNRQVLNPSAFGNYQLHTSC
jgi:hypothetical protein